MIVVLPATDSTPCGRFAIGAGARGAAGVTPELDWRGDKRVIFQGLLPFDRHRLSRDILGGITFAAVGIPAVMGYSKIIGTPVITGLYTMLLPMMAFAVFGSSRHLVVAA